MANFAENKMACASCGDRCSEGDMVRSNKTANNIIAIIADIRILVSVFVAIISIIGIIGIIDLGISVLLLAGLLISLIILSILHQPHKRRIALM